METSKLQDNGKCKSKVERNHTIRNSLVTKMHVQVSVKVLSQLTIKSGQEFCFEYGFD